MGVNTCARKEAKEEKPKESVWKEQRESPKRPKLHRYANPR